MKFTKHQIITFLILGSILFIAAFLRLYRIEDYMRFLGDEGRDVLVVKKIIVDHEFTLLGPITSVGLMHLGPMYYYFMIPFLALSGLNPVGPAIMVALFSLATIVLLWQFCAEFINKRVGFFATVFYALSPLVIEHSHSSWNPNILPFFALLMIYGLAKVISQKSYKWLGIVGVAFGIALQLHYVSLVFIPIVFVSLMLIKFRIPIKYYALGLAGFALLFSPFILFEIRHQFINTTTIIAFITRGGEGKTFALLTVFGRFWDLSVRLFWRLVIYVQSNIAQAALVTSVGVSLFVLLTSKNQKLKQALGLILIWYIVGIGVLSLYTGSIYDYYLMFGFPIPFIMLGVFLDFISRKKFGLPVSLILLLSLVVVQVQRTPILKEPNRLAYQAEMIADFVLEQTDGQPYNFAILAAGNSDHAYRYFLDIGNNPPIVIENEVVDPQRKSVTDQLLVVCEEKECKPLGDSLWEIAGFGRAEIVDEWKVGLFKVMKLVHYVE